MTDIKYSKAKLPSWNAMAVRSPRNKNWKGLPYSVGLTFAVGVSVLLIMIYHQNAGGSIRWIGNFKTMISTLEVELEEQGTFNSYTFQPNVSDWDEQRTWTTKDVTKMKEGETELSRPRVLMVTDSSPEPCETISFSQIFLRAAKNKLDYCRMHDIELFYNMGNADPEFTDWWAKLPIIRMLMLEHPEVEWIWWMDADFVITDLSFEPPFTKFEKFNLVLYGNDGLVYTEAASTGLRTSNYMIRNCQWSLDLLDAWASMGTGIQREKAPEYRRDLLKGQPPEVPRDDQSSLIAMLTKDRARRVGKQRWASKVRLVKESMNANWTVVAPELEKLSSTRQRVPFLTHFAGCLPFCTPAKPDHDLSEELLHACMEQMQRAFDFADNQVYEKLGFHPRKLGSSTEPMTRKLNQSDEKKFLTGGNENLEFSIPPKETDWDEKRLDWVRKNHYTKKDHALLVSGSSPQPCKGGRVGSYMLLRGLKNFIDYGRTSGVKVFYNNAAIDKNLAGWWSKIPLLKILMLNNPAVEWIWWMDSDAAFTKLDFKFPFERYNASGYNIIMYGNEEFLFTKNSFNAVNTGNFLIRNCQWSLDLLDRWASFGATRELRVKNEALLNENLKDRPHGWSADDQCVLIYLFISEREKWGSKVTFPDDIVMSGNWEDWVKEFEADSLKPENRPFVTHFAGCKPCQEYVEERCLASMQEVYNYADDQVLQRYGIRHDSLNSTALHKLSFSDHGSEVQ